MTTPELESIDVNMMTSRVVEEVFFALGMSKTGFACRYFGWMVRPIARRFAVLWVPFDLDLGKYGTQVAARNFLPHFVKEVKVHGSETIPPEGPLLVASNHPGAYDSVAIIAQIPRPDVKVVVSDIPFFKYMPNGRKHVFYATDEPSTRMNAVRASIRHLQEGGCLVIFPTGLIDPDPDVWGETEASLHLEHWSSSLELFMKKVPQTNLVVTIASGVLDAGWAESRITRIVKPGIDRRRLAEFGQVISQLLRPGRKLYTPHVSFDPPATLDDLGRGEGEAMRSMIARAKTLLTKHKASDW
jgi:1-acyl-sn-glycerol-3-phosphate acyltransferase